MMQLKTNVTTSTANADWLKRYVDSFFMIKKQLHISGLTIDQFRKNFKSYKDSISHRAKNPYIIPHKVDEIRGFFPPCVVFF